MTYIIAFTVHLFATIIFAIFIGWYCSKEDTRKAFRELHEAKEEFRQEVVSTINRILISLRGDK